MGSKWEKIKIEQLQGNQKGAIAIGPFGSRMKSDCYVPYGIPVVRGTNISSGPDFKGEFVYISPELADTLGSCNVYKNDLIFPHRGSIGEVGIINDNNRYVLSSSMMKLTCDCKKVKPMFLYYFFKSQKGRNELLKNASQVGTPGIAQPLSSLKQIEIELPPLSIQNKIIEIIENLDKKISLNNNLNQILEQMSQTLFKSWFVDFDPVIDNALDAEYPIPEALQSRAELRQKVRNSADFKPLPADIRVLFPAEFEEIELGWVPKGWKEGSIPDIAFINSTSWGTKNQPDYVNYVDLSNAKDGIISSIENITFTDAPSRARRILKKDDLIFGLVRPANRSFAYVHADGLTGSTGFAVVRAKNTIYKNFIYYFVTYDKNVEELARIADGGAYPAIKPDDICSLPLIIPPEEIVQKFDESTSRFRDLMNNSLVQNDYLTNLRDTLLPKLISGELSLEDLPNLVAQTEPA